MKVVALSGGVGGARLVDGLDAVLPAADLSTVVNTGDDFPHWGLWISPDLDTVMYTLAGLAHRQQGWGLADETFSALAMVERYGGDAWFRLGDRDLATHLLRTAALAAGESLTAITARLCKALGVKSALVPMADGPRPTLIETPEGVLGFQDWLVRRRAEPAVTRVIFSGPPAAAPAAIEALSAADLVIIGPSNPYVSIDPILSLDGVRSAIAGKPVIAVSPIVGGRAIKGPLAGMIERLAVRPPSPAAIASHYRGLLTGMVIERGDEPPPDLPVLATDTVMGDRDDRARLAREVIEWATR